MLFYSFFKSLVGKDVIIELKNDLSICGTLHSVDQFLNIKLTGLLLYIKYLYIYRFIACLFIFFRPKFTFHIIKPHNKNH